MQKTKFGITVSLMAAAVYFTCFFGGYAASIILVGYILIREEDAWLRRTGVKAVALMIGFSLLSTFIGYIPDGIQAINSLLALFDESFSVEILTKILYFLINVLNLVESIVFVVLGFKALKYTETSVPVIDNVVNTHMS